MIPPHKGEGDEGAGKTDVGAYFAGRSAVGAEPVNGGGGLADQAVAAALRYRSQASLIDTLMSEPGLPGGSLDGLATSVTQAAPVEAKGRK